MEVLEGEELKRAVLNVLSMDCSFEEALFLPEDTGLVALRVLWSYSSYERTL